MSESVQAYLSPGTRVANEMENEFSNRAIKVGYKNFNFGGLICDLDRFMSPKHASLVVPEAERLLKEYREVVQLYYELNLIGYPEGEEVITLLECTRETQLAITQIAELNKDALRIISPNRTATQQQKIPRASVNRFKLMWGIAQTKKRQAQHLEE